MYVWPTRMGVPSGSRGEGGEGGTGSLLSDRLGKGGGLWCQPENNKYGMIPQFLVSDVILIHLLQLSISDKLPDVGQGKFSECPAWLF